ncbi:diacylglycerol/lipid kinase family protein [Hamadaea tsunoensis]|uniref:diacylglycerol/lipid kinase family protein n=1 Tax=Hamadaea tsunoensis TaxID=53368 RepID=UPI00041E6590|nr:diacylglycerol kinase family protein [Hamadaea tsunoensis]
MSPPPLRNRLAAVGALLALAGAIAAVGWVLLRHPFALAVTLVAVAGAVLSGWLALVNRGARRIFGLALAVACLTAAGWLLGLTALAGVITVIVLSVASVALARAAIGRHRPLAPDTGPPPVAVSVKAALKPVLIVNPASGGADPALAARARRRGIRVETLTPGQDLQELADSLVRDGATAIGIAGGDGSQALVADVARRHGVAFVCVPAGTRNHFAQDLGLDKTDPVRALDGFGRAVERRIDLGSVNGRVFVNNVSLGAYAMIVQAQEYREAKLLTAATMLPDLLGADAAPFDLRFAGPDGEPYDSAALILVSNNPYAVATPVALGGRPRIDTGELGILVVRARPLAVQSWTASGLTVESGAPVPVGIDGEALELEPPLVFEALSDVLRVRLPRGTVAPGAVGRVPGFRQTTLALWNILRNRPPWN